MDNINQSVDEIIKSSSPAQRILWQQVRRITRENASVQQIIYNGSISVPFTTFVSGFVFLAYEISIYNSSAVQAGSINKIVAYNHLNVASYRFGIGYPFWNATTASQNTFLGVDKWENIFFGRIDSAGSFNLMHFNGFRIG